MSPLVLAVVVSARTIPLARAFLYGVVAGGVYFAGTLYWVAETMQLHGGLPLVVGVLVALLLVAYLALYVGLFAWLLGSAVRRFGVAAVWFAPAVWVATEWARSTVGGGFPWVQLGASQATVLPIVQVSSVAGVYGLSALVAAVGTAAAALAVSRTRATRWGATSVAALLIGVTVAGAWRVSRGALLDQGEPIRVGLVQGSIAQEQKWDPRFRSDILERYLTLSRQTLADGAELVIWPESSTPFTFDVDAPPAQPIRQLAADARTPFLLGTDQLIYNADGQLDRYYNAAVLVDADGQAHQAYYKMQLVPFGEYVPLKSLLFFIGPLVHAVSDFSAGTEAVVFDADGRRVSVAICYESVYPSIARQFVDNGSALLATITNDAWFGRSSAAYQHFQQGAIRAVEQGRYVVRAANTGISGAVDPYGRVIAGRTACRCGDGLSCCATDEAGRVLASTPLFEPAAVTVDVRLLTHRTIYGRTGDWVVWWALAMTALLGVSIVRDRRPGRPPRSESTR